MRKQNLAFIDIETTGLDLTKNEIIEIGCVLTTPKLEVIEEFDIKVKPERIEYANPTSLKVNHYNEDDWLGAISIKDAMEIFLEKVRDSIMVGQNISFDSSFIDYTLASLGMENTMHYHKLDTLAIAWAKLHKDEEIRRFSLRELCAHFGIKNARAHSALSDARATYELYKKLMGL